MTQKNPFGVVHPIDVPVVCPNCSTLTTLEDMWKTGSTDTRVECPECNALGAPVDQILREEYFAFVADVHKECSDTLVRAVTVEKEQFDTWMLEALYEAQMSPAQAAVYYCWASLDSNSKKRLTLIDGTFGSWPSQVTHSWIRIIPNVEAVGDIRQGFIIDPACPSIVPSCLKIHQSSPVWQMYHG